MVHIHIFSVVFQIVEISVNSRCAHQGKICRECICAFGRPEGLKKVSLRGLFFKVVRGRCRAVLYVQEVLTHFFVTYYLYK